jgi:hypothetical protein
MNLAKIKLAEISLAELIESVTEMVFAQFNVAEIIFDPQASSR